MNNQTEVLPSEIWAYYYDKDDQIICSKPYTIKDGAKYTRIPAGHVLVPIEPTEEILDAMCEVGPDTNSGCFDWEDARTVYEAMITASQKKG